MPRTKKLLDRVGLPEDPDTKVMDIGVGKQQLVEIAKALSKDVKLLILDEPTRGIDAAPSMRSTKSSISLPMQARPSS